jgi:hypothetical protein
MHRECPRASRSIDNIRRYPARAESLVTKLSVLFVLLVPSTVPSVVAAYAVVGEGEQEAFEPVVTTPVRSEEFLIGKALAVLVPTLAVPSRHVRGRPAARRACQPRPPAVAAHVLLRQTPESCLWRSA